MMVMMGYICSLSVSPGLVLFFQPERDLVPVAVVVVEVVMTAEVVVVVVVVVRWWW